MLENIALAGQKRTIVIQTMVASLGNTPFPQEQQEAYVQQIMQLIEQGCQIQRIQLYTIARTPGQANLPENCDITAVTAQYLNDFRSCIHNHLPQIQVDLF
ncbi:hypothetical protein JYU15_00645 [bacterium AH-315-I18]|nr:hypothetical protein [bacterium AH-315-I18]